MSVFIFLLIRRRPPRSHLTDPLFAYTTLFRSPLTIFAIDRSPGRTSLMMATVASRSIMEGWLTPSALGRCLAELLGGRCAPRQVGVASGGGPCAIDHSLPVRSEEHTSELQSLMRISYAVFCLKKKKQIKHKTQDIRRTITT